jgi:hypothetical protein
MLFYGTDDGPQQRSPARGHPSITLGHWCVFWRAMNTNGADGTLLDAGSGVGLLGQRCSPHAEPTVGQGLGESQSGNRTIHI